MHECMTAYNYINALNPNSITLSWSQTWSHTCSELEFGLSRTI